VFADRCRPAELSCFGRRRVGDIIDCVERDLFTIAEGMAAGGDPKVDRPGNMEGVLAG
jgi:hypothetical protein